MEKDRRNITEQKYLYVKNMKMKIKGICIRKKSKNNPEQNV